MWVEEEGVGGWWLAALHNVCTRLNFTKLHIVARSDLAIDVPLVLLVDCVDICLNEACFTFILADCLHRSFQFPDSTPHSPEWKSRSF